MTGSFAEIEITPPPGTLKIGWLKEIVGTRAIDPLMARVCVLQSAGVHVAFVQLDTLSVSRRMVADIRKRVADKYDFPGANVMVGATHNHAGPAIVRAGEVKADAKEVERVTGLIVDAFGVAMNKQELVEVGFAHRHVHALANNRRVVMRDGTVRTHGTFDDPNALALEGPVDPELSLLVVRAKDDGQPMGCVANYTCHPTHEGPTENFSAGWPGVFAREMAKAGRGVTLFFNGALGNVGTTDPRRANANMGMAEMGTSLAVEAGKAMEKVTLADELKLASRSEVIQLPFRTVTDDEVHGTTRGAQRFIDSKIYDRLMPQLVEEIKSQGSQPAEVQVIDVGDHAFVSIPAELFVELGLRIKERAYPRRAVIVGLANGMVGYVPTKEAFARGGYETTFLNTSKLDHNAGDMLDDAAVRLVKAGA
jgi:hypothetical protein